MPRKGPHVYTKNDREVYERQQRRKQAIKRLTIALDYDGPTNNRGVPTALGDFILERWRNDNSTSSYDKVERLLDVLASHPEVAEKEIDQYLQSYDDTLSGLTHQERRGLYFASMGFQVKHVARLDGVSEETIRMRLTKARRKLHAVNTTHAVAIAIRKNLLWT